MDNQTKTVDRKPQLGLAETKMVRIPVDKLPVCGCRKQQGFSSGWCGIAGGGVPACDH